MTSRNARGHMRLDDSEFSSNSSPIFQARNFLLEDFFDFRPDGEVIGRRNRGRIHHLHGVSHAGSEGPALGAGQ